MHPLRRPSRRPWTTWLGLTSVLLLSWNVSATGQDVPPAVSTSAPLLWRIHGSTPSYLFGTIHIADERVLALDPVVAAALDDSDALYTEIPMDPATMLHSMRLMMLPDNKTLSDLLPEELYQRMERFVSSRGLSMQMFSRFQLWAVSASLTLLDAMKDMAARQPLDLLLYNRASESGKEVGGIETVDEQIAILESLSLEEEIDFLARTLETLEEAEAEGESYLERLIETYVEGDENELLEFLFQFGGSDDSLVEKYLDRLLNERNRLMAERISRKLEEQSERAFFFALGAGHLGGSQGLVALLRERGLEVERVGPGSSSATARR